MKLKKMSQSQKLPFRIGTTSYVYPDEILPNVHKLKGKVNDIELILFEAINAGNVPRQKDLKELKRVGNEWDLTYTVHLPLDISLGSALGNKRENSIAQVNSLIEYLSILDPYAYILHLNLPRQAERNIKLWQDRVRDSLEKIVKNKTAIAKNIAIENLSYPFSYIDSLTIENNFSVCVDIGHLIAMGIDPAKHCKRYSKVMRVIHLHGVNGRKDHVSLKYLDGVLMRRIARFLKEDAYHGVLTLEVFSQTDFEESMGILWENLYS